VKIRTPTHDLLLNEFAAAVAVGALDEAEGWVRAAIYATRRDEDRRISLCPAGFRRSAGATVKPHC
jgi:hypothetical protein